MALPPPFLEPPRAGGWGAVKKVPLRSKTAQASGFDRVIVRLFLRIHFFLGLGCKMSTKQPKGPTFSFFNYQK